MNLIDRMRAELRQVVEAMTIPLPDSPLIVAVSGGPDSLALLHLLAQLIPAESLIVAHLDHGLRLSSAAEATRVAAVARGLRVHVERLDVAQLAQTQRLSLEEAGRTARYDFLARVARAEGAAVIAVGHNADDQAETVLMHLLRGSGLAGLQGMRPLAPLPDHPDLLLWRPLLGIDRTEIEAYCAEHDLQPIQDASNTDLTFYRNRLRHELLPLLETYSPQIRRHLTNLAEIVAGDEALLHELTDHAWADTASAGGHKHVTLRLMAWRQLPLGMRRRVLRRAIATVRPALRDVGFQTLEAARHIAEDGQTGSRASLPDGLMLVVDYDQLRLMAGTDAPTDAAPQLPTVVSMPLPIPGEIALANGWRLSAAPVDAPDPQAITHNSDPWTAYVALAPAAELAVRPRRPGERIRPLGLGGERKIKKVMIDRKLPARLRERWPIVATAEQPIWVVGHVVDDRVRVRPVGGRVVRLQCRRWESENRD